MKKRTKDNKGITLIALIITIIIMLILISVTTYTGLSTYNSTKVDKFVDEMQLLQSKIDDLVASMTKEELANLNLASVSTQEQKNALSSAFSNGEIKSKEETAYKVFSTNNILNILNVENVKNDIMVNFETREIVSVGGVKYDGKKYYTQYKLPHGQTLTEGTEFTRDIGEFTVNLSIDGINSEIEVSNISITNGTLSYQEQNGTYWTVITNYTQKNESYRISLLKSGNYIFRVQDNNSLDNKVEKNVKITLTNKPKTNLSLVQSYDYGQGSEKWAYVTNDSKKYVWIPRFVYNNSGEIKYIKGTSNVATDDTYIDDENWTLDSNFTSQDGKSLTGIWVEVTSVNQTGLDMKNLLSDSTKTFLEEVN